MGGQASAFSFTWVTGEAAAAARAHLDNVIAEPRATPDRPEPATGPAAP
ncbi:hypothetical protein [Streptomyces acidicola]